MKNLTFTLILLFFATAANCREPNIFNIKNYGAVGDSLTMNTEAIQATINACHETGGGVVWVPDGDFVVGTIQLKCNNENPHPDRREMIVLDDVEGFRSPSQPPRGEE